MAYRFGHGLRGATRRMSYNASFRSQSFTSNYTRFASASSPFTSSTQTKTMTMTYTPSMYSMTPSCMVYSSIRS